MVLKKLRPPFILLFLILAFGTTGYTLVEGMSLFNAFYMTIITISTVGFSEIEPLSKTGRLITIIVITVGITTGGYTIGMLLRMFIEGELSAIMGRKKLEKLISELKDHYIVCGYGRIGQLICTELNAHSIPFVVIEKDPLAVNRIESKGFLYIQMDSTSDDALAKAGIMRAKGLVTVVQSDADNVFITLSAKGLRPDIFVLARASDQQNEGKMMRAGATRVVSPYLIGGKRMAQVLIRPTVVDFIDIAMMDSHLGLRMEEAKVGGQSGLIGKKLMDSGLRQNFGVIIVAIKKQSGEMIFNPMPTEIIDSGDIIVVLGKHDDLKRMHSVL